MRYCAGKGLGSGLGSAARLAGYGELRRSKDRVLEDVFLSDLFTIVALLQRGSYEQL